MMLIMKDDGIVKLYCFLDMSVGCRKFRTFCSLYNKEVIQKKIFILATDGYMTGLFRC